MQQVNGANTRRFTLTRLRPNTYYRIMLASYNAAGEGPSSLDIVDQTADLSAVPPSDIPIFIDDGVSYNGVTSTRRTPLLPPRSHTPSSGDSVLLYAVLAAVLGVLLFLGFLFFFLCWLKQKKRQQSRE